MEKKEEVKYFLKISVLNLQNFDPLEVLQIPSTDMADLRYQIVKSEFKKKISIANNIVEKIKLTISTEFLYFKIYQTQDERFIDESDDILRSQAYFLILFQPSSFHDYTLLGQKEYLKESMKGNNKALFSINQIERTRTLLYIAARSGYLEICELLIKAGADLNIQCSMGSTALIAASFFGHKEISELMARSGCDLEIINNSGNSAIKQAKVQEIKKIIEDSKICKVSALIRNLRNKDLLFSSKNIYYQQIEDDQSLEEEERLIGIRMIINPQKIPEAQQKSYEDAYLNWIPVYHGTKQENLESIVTNGLLPPGSTTKQGKKIETRPGHIKDSVDCRGYKKFAVGIFTTSSIWYAAKYGETIVDSNNKEWSLLLTCFIKPDSYNTIENTTVGYVPQQGEVESELEYRHAVENLTSQTIFEVGESSNIVLKTIFLIEKSFLEKALTDTDRVNRFITPHHLNQFEDIFLLTAAAGLGASDIQRVNQLKGELRSCSRSVSKQTQQFIIKHQPDSEYHESEKESNSQDKDMQQTIGRMTTPKRNSQAQEQQDEISIRTMTGTGSELRRSRLQEFRSLKTG